MLNNPYYKIFAWILPDKKITTIQMDYTQSSLQEISVLFYYQISDKTNFPFCFAYAFK